MCTCPEELTVPVSKLQGPFMEWLIEESGCPQTDLPDFCHKGFSDVGTMPEFKLDSVENMKVTWSMTPEDLWNSRVESNQKILGSLWDSEYDDEVHEKTIQDAEEGCNTVPEEATESRCAEVCLTRRMAVPELRKSYSRMARLRIIRG